MFCKYCGQEVDSDSIFCEVCGKKIKKASAYQAPITQEPIMQEPIKQEPIIQEPVIQEPVKQDTVQYDTNSVLYYYNNSSAETKPVEQEDNHTYTSKYEKMLGYSGSLSPVDTTPDPETENKRDSETPLNSKKKKGDKLPYILLPVGCFAAGLIATIFQLAGAFVTNLISNRAFFNMYDYIGNEAIIYKAGFIRYAIQEITSVLAYALPFVIVLILFSLCCKGFYKKAMFVGSAYVAQIGGIISTAAWLIIGHVGRFMYDYHSFMFFNERCFTTGFYGSSNLGSFFIVTIVTGVINIIICPGLALLFFKWSQKYTVKKEEKSRPSKLILPCVFLGLHSFLNLVFQILATWCMYAIFYNSPLVMNTGKLIAMGLSYVCIFLLALACKGGYRKVAFVGSAFFSTTILGFLPSLMGLIGSLISINWYNPAFTIGQGLQYLLAIPVSIVLYIILNKYVVEKVKKKKIK